MPEGLIASVRHGSFRISDLQNSGEMEDSEALTAVRRRLIGIDGKNRRELMTEISKCLR